MLDWQIKHVQGLKSSVQKLSDCFRECPVLWFKKAVTQVCAHKNERKGVDFDTQGLWETFNHSVVHKTSGNYGGWSLDHLD